MKTKLLFISFMLFSLLAFSQSEQPFKQKVHFYNSATFDRSPVVPIATTNTAAVSLKQMRDTVAARVGIAGTATNISGGAGGQVLYQSASGVTAKLTNGINGDVLTSSGGTASPAWKGSADLESVIGMSLATDTIASKAYARTMRGSGGGSYSGMADSVKVLSANPSTGNIYISTTDSKLHYRVGSQWYTITGTAEGGGGGSTITIVDSYSETNSTAAHYLSSINDQGVGQTFTPNVTSTITSAKFYLIKEGAPTGYATAKLYAITGTYGTTSIPTGAVLATSGTFDVSTLSTSTSALVTFTFGTGQNYSMTGGSRYAIVVTYSGGDVTNRVMVHVDTTTPTHGGNDFELAGGTYYPNDTYDCIFYVYASH